jgi:hypothetical protein
MARAVLRALSPARPTPLEPLSSLTTPGHHATVPTAPAPEGPLAPPEAASFRLGTEDFRHIFPALVPACLGYIIIVERLGHRARCTPWASGWRW